MNNPSWKHHYLPKFYLNGFTKESNTLKIYDVTKSRLIKSGKDFSTESYFYEQNSNTVSINGISNDYIETKYYKKFDDNIAKLFKRINDSNSENQFGLNEFDLPVLNHFVSLMYWRLPNKQEELKTLIKNKSLKELGLIITNYRDVENESESEKLKKDPEFQKGYKFFHSLMDSVRGYECRTPYSILETTDQMPFLCSDNPIIFESKTPKVYEDDYLFPLSGNKLFIRSNKRKDFPFYLRILVDMIVYKQASKYVGCSDQKYIGHLEEMFNKSNLTLDDHKQALFKTLNSNIT